MSRSDGKTALAVNRLLPRIDQMDFAAIAVLAQIAENLAGPARPLRGADDRHGRSPQHARRRTQHAVTARHACSPLRLVLPCLVSHFATAGYAHTGDADCMNGVAQECVSTDWKETPTAAWPGAAISRRRCCGVSASSISASTPARAIAVFTTAWSIISAMKSRHHPVLHEDHSVLDRAWLFKGDRRADGLRAALHVGLLHGMMGLFNAWCDRAPLFVLAHRAGGGGKTPALDRLDSYLARQGAYIRSIIKWDDQPTSPDALVEIDDARQHADALGAHGARLYLSRRRLSGTKARQRAGMA